MISRNSSTPPTPRGQFLQAIVRGLQQAREIQPENAAPVTTPELEADILEARKFPEGFFAWLRHWRFKNRESGAVLTFRDPWPGQREFADLMVETARLALTMRDWLGIFALKAGKLGFTELEAAWDGYSGWARNPSNRVHLFSKGEAESKDMLEYVRFGLRSLEPAWGVRFLSSQEREIDASKAGSKLFKYTVLQDGVRDYNDVRQMVSFATGKFPAINESCVHAHVDEWCHMQDPAGAWGSIETTIAPGGTGHIVSRGAGEHEYVQNTWLAAVETSKTREAGGDLHGASKLSGFFAPYSARPDRDEAWRRSQAATLPTQAALAHFAAESPEDAFLGAEDQDFVPIEMWDACAEFICCAAGHWRGGEGLEAWDTEGCGACREADATGALRSYLATHPLRPGDLTRAIIGADAGTSHDTFGLVLVTRHPLRPLDPAIRLRKLWKPADFEDGVVDYGTAESWLRSVCRGGCPLGHPTADPEWRSGKKCRPLKGQTWAAGECPACAAILAGEMQPLPRFNVVQIAFDPSQLINMMQSLTRDGIVWCKKIDQGGPRLVADRTFYDMIMGGRLGHTGDDQLREHVSNARKRTDKADDSKLRIIKKAEHRKIDLTVAASMAVEEILRLQV